VGCRSEALEGRGLDERRRNIYAQIGIRVVGCKNKSNGRKYEYILQKTKRNRREL
jgi:hypothetical protein